MGLAGVCWSAEVEVVALTEAVVGAVAEAVAGATVGLATGICWLAWC